MKKITPEQIELLPVATGVFCFYDEQKTPLYAGVAENIKREVRKIISEHSLRHGKIKFAAIEFSETSQTVLIRVFAETIRRKKPLYNISLANQKLYPHLKITSEKFSRLLVTRRIENDGAEYFGAFLSETRVRFLLDFLNRVFRLRNCTVAIDGNFPLPCTMFYEKRCVAPCVEDICNKNLYDEFVELVRLFLEDKRENLQTVLLEKIQLAAKILDFEKAAYWRDILFKAQSAWSEKELQVWLNEAVDSFEVEEKGGQVFVRLITQRGRKILGTCVFVFETTEDFTSQKILSELLWQYYQFHSPKEIRLNEDFPSRKFLAEVLSHREDRTVKISVIKSTEQKIITERALKQSKYEFNLEQIKPFSNFKGIQQQLKKQFNLKYLPRRIICFDVAHISGTNFVAAKCVWENGEFLIDEYEYWFLNEKNELKTITEGIRKSFETNYKSPDLILIDGGKSQLNAVLNVLSNFSGRKFTVIAAVKPPRKHNEISHFIAEDGKIYEMKPESTAMQMLVSLRDATHKLANTVHRSGRDTAHFYELVGILPASSEKERSRLLKKFGSIKNIRQTTENDLIDFLGVE